MSFIPRLRSTWGWLPFLIIVLQPTAVSAQPFHVAPIYQPDTNVRTRLASADLNGDGKLDLVGVDWENQVVVLLGDESGGFGPPSFPPAGENPAEVTIADFNSDSILDLAIADMGTPYPRPEEIEAGILPSSSPGRLVVLFGDGTGAFGPPITVNASDGPNFSWILSGDFNGDGHSDLMSTWGDLLVWLGDGTGHFAAPLNVPIGSGAKPRVADFNSDGRLDLALAGDLVRILLGDGAGGFGPAQLYQTGGQPSQDLAVGDFNGDGKVDFAAWTDNGIYLFPGDGTGDFGQALQTPGGGFVGTIVGDFNEDGKLDLASGGGLGIRAVLGDGAGHFAPGPAYVAGTREPGPYGPLLAADVNGDSHLDLVTSGYGIAVLLGDGTARFDALQPLASPVDFLPQVAAADFNEDGKLDIVLTGYNDPGLMLLGDGQGGLSNAASVGYCGGSQATRLGDFNGDTHVDLLGVGQDQVCVFLGDGNGSLADPVITPLISSARFAVADFNEDGRSDLVVSRTPDDVVWIFLSNGQGGFAAPLEYLMRTGPYAVAAGDWNGDGHADLASAGAYSMDLSVRLGDGTGGFGPRAVIPLGTSGSEMIVGDWNGDGKPDLGLDSGHILLGDGAGGFALTGTFPSAPFLAGDFNFDGHLDVASLVGAQNPSDALLLSPGDGAGGFGAPWSYYAPTSHAGVASGDFNGDGRPDVMLAVDGALWPFLSVSMNVDLAVTVDDGQAGAVPGGTVSYLVTLTNLGPHSIPAAQLTALLPAILLSPTFSPSAGAYDPTTGVWTGLNVQAGASVTLTIAGTVDASATGSMTVSVLAAPPSGYLDPNSANNASSDVDVLTPVADLGLQLSDVGDPVPVGAATTLDASVTNAGPSTSPGGTLSILLPLGATFVSASPGCTDAGGIVTCSLPGLAPAQGATMSVSATLEMAGLATTSAFVAGAVPDPQASNDTAIEATSVLAGPLRELVPGSTVVSALQGGLAPGPPTDVFRVQQAPRSSWEIVVDGVTGDIGAGAGPVVEFVDDGAVAHPSVAAGAGASRSLRLENPGPGAGEGYVRVASAGCSFDCGPEDVYRIRARETTLFGARFNNSATQVTVVVVQNASSDAVGGHVDFWDTSGTWLHGEPFTLQPWQVLLLNPSGIPAIQGRSGSVSASHNGRLGALAGKTTAVEPATGFTFDTPFVPRPR